MKFVSFEIEQFGKLQKQHIPLGDGINLITGENEAGKTTLHTFIRSVLFGMTRGRGRAAARDTFHRYEPWEGGRSYGGAIRFESGGKTFLLRRDFARKEEFLFCETDGEELSLAAGDLAELIPGLTESTYDNTLSIGQLKAAAGEPLSEALKDYAAGYYATGGSDLSLTTAKKTLNTKRKEVEKEIRDRVDEKQRRRERLTLEASHLAKDMAEFDEELEELAQTEAPDSRVGAQTSGGRYTLIGLVLLLAGVICSLALLSDTARIVGIAASVLAAVLCVAAGRRSAGGSLAENMEDRPEDWRRRLLARRKEKSIEHANINEQIRELDEVDEGVRQLEEKREALLLASRRMDEISAGMQKDLTYRLNREMSGIMNQISGGKYSEIYADENLVIHILTEGRRIPLGDVSRGTVEQVYFALRMAAADLMYEEGYPILLDDAFVFYDEERLGRVLAWLSDSKRQVLLFTCQAREENILNSMRIPYEKIYINGA